MILPAWFDGLEENFSYYEFLFKMFCLPMKTSSLLVETVSETPGKRPVTAGS